MGPGGATPTPAASLQSSPENFGTLLTRRFPPPARRKRPSMAMAGRVYDNDNYDDRGADRAWQLAFADAWPAVERSLRRVLRARHVPRGEWDDYLQEVAARALAARVEFG